VSAFDGLGEGLRRLRARRGLRQSDLSERARISKPQISKIERGVQRPNIETLERLLDALPATLRELELALNEAREGEAGSRQGARVSAEASRAAATWPEPEVVFQPPPGLRAEERAKLTEVAQSFGDFLYLVGERTARTTSREPERDDGRS